MIAFAERQMAKQEVRPPDENEEDNANTRQIRVNKDLADMLGEIIEVLKMRGEKNPTVAVLVDPWLRGAVEEEHGRLKETIDQIRALKQKAKDQKSEKKPRKS